MVTNTVCVVCDKKADKKCGGCLSRAYCSAECQKDDWPTHKSQCQRRNYILKVDLLPQFIRSPCISRTLSCPATTTFADLHQALLVAFGWADTHLYDFDVFDHNDTLGRENRLLGPEPIFKITDLRTVEENNLFPGPLMRESSKTKLYTVLDNPKTKGNTIHFNYDFGDGWEHVITCVEQTEATTHFVCLGGEGHACAEDVGGYYGWKKLLEAYNAEYPTQDQKEMIEWYESIARNGDSEGLRGEKKWKWDKDNINKALTQLDGGDRDGPETTDTSILLVSLNKQSFFDELYSEVLMKLRSKAAIVEETQVASALQHISGANKRYNTIIVTDPSVMNSKMIAVKEKLVDYAQNGGTVILGFLFSSFSRPTDLNSFFKRTWSLNWQFGDYCRQTFSLNERAGQNSLIRCQPGLPHQYSMKAVHIKNAKPEEMIYVSSPSSVESPVVFANYGRGFLGWIGDVNTEEGTTALLLKRACPVSEASKTAMEESEKA